MSKFKIVEVKDNIEEWNKLVFNSPEGTVFSLYEYLNSIGLDYKFYFVKKGNEVRAGFSFLVNKDDSEIIFDDLIIYNGIMFALNDKQKETRQKTERYDIAEEIIKFLDAKYKKMTFQLSPNFEDMRPFLWHNYHSDNMEEKFKINIRYTSFIDIHDLFYKKDIENSLVYQALDNRRQTDIVKAQENGLTFISEEVDTKEFIAFYKKTLLSQDKQVDEAYLSRMATLIDSTSQKDLLKKYAVENSENQTSYIVIFGIFKNVGTYIFGSGDADVMQRYDATYCIWKAIKDLNHNYGISTIDMEGINSPQRGAYKLDFGGSITPYYQVQL
ncbi:MAG: hypothetical protein K0U38_02230 [Epsilonproteobacteria bacterium]|nr:hypothetical protein [Campylobacterota bacterium]